MAVRETHVVSAGVDSEEPLSDKLVEDGQAHQAIQAAQTFDLTSSPLIGRVTFAPTSELKKQSTVIGNGTLHGRFSYAFSRRVGVPTGTVVRYQPVFHGIWRSDRTADQSLADCAAELGCDELLLKPTLGPAAKLADRLVML